MLRNSVWQGCRSRLPPVAYRSILSPWWKAAPVSRQSPHPWSRLARRSRGTTCPPWILAPRTRIHQSWWACDARRTSSTDQTKTIRNEWGHVSLAMILVRINRRVVQKTKTKKPEEEKPWRKRRSFTNFFSTSPSSCHTSTITRKLLILLGSIKQRPSATNLSFSLHCCVF